MHPEKQLGNTKRSYSSWILQKGDKESSMQLIEPQDIYEHGYTRFKKPNFSNKVFNNRCFEKFVIIL